MSEAKTPDGPRFVHVEAMRRLFALRQGPNPVAWRAFGVGTSLATYINSKTGEATVKRDKIAERANIDARDVSRELRELEARGFIVTEPHPGGASTYRLATLGESATPGKSPAGTSAQGTLGQDTQGPLGKSPKGSRTKSSKKSRKKGGAQDGGSVRIVPEELEGLDLYEKNAKLCKKWPELVKAWQKAYPNIDIMAEVARAHAWEVARPRRRKRDKARFMDGWLRRATQPNPYQQAKSGDDRNSQSDLLRQAQQPQSRET